MQLRPPIDQVIDKTYGYWAESSGKKFLDLQLGYSSYTWGYNNDLLIKSLYSGINDQVGVIRHDQTAEKLEMVNKRLLDKTRMKALLWTISGSDAVEAAIQIATQYQNKTFNKLNFISFSPGYHGCTWLARILNGERRHSNFINVVVPDWKKIEEREAIESMLWNKVIQIIEKDSQVGSIVVESMPWFNGHRPWSDGWWVKMSQLQKERNILLIIDDIACGFGKVAPLTSHLRYSIKPDIVAIGKALTGGHAPSSCALVGSKIFPVIKEDYWWHGHTWHPYLPALNLVNTILDITNDDHFYKIEEKLDNWLKTNTKIDHYRGIGLMREVFFKNIISDENIIKAGLIVSKKSENSMSLIVPQIADTLYWNELEERINRL